MCPAPNRRVCRHIVIHRGFTVLPPGTCVESQRVHSTGDTETSSVFTSSVFPPPSRHDRVPEEKWSFSFWKGGPNGKTDRSRPSVPVKITVSVGPLRERSLPPPSLAPGRGGRTTQGPSPRSNRLAVTGGGCFKRSVCVLFDRKIRTL